MKKSLIALAVMGASTVAFAASNVTLYGVIEEGVVVQKAKHKDTTVSLKSGFDQGSRWGLRGVEELGNGYSVSFILEQGFNADTGSESVPGKQFNRETIIAINGGFGSFAFGRTGGLGSGAQSQQILTGWALGTGYNMSAWNSRTAGTLRADNALSYKTPVFSGFSLHAMYSNGVEEDNAKWSKNNHYYGLGVKYDANAIKSSLIFEALDNKGTKVAKTWADLGLSDDVIKALGEKKDAEAIAAEPKERVYIINYGLEYNLGSWTPMFAYQWYNQDGGKKLNTFGLSAKIGVGGGDALIGARYAFGDDESIKTGDQSVRAWDIGAAYVYPLSKRTAIKAYAGYADASKGWKNKEDALYNGYSLFLGMRTSF